jgi:hypothetical protein
MRMYKLALGITVGLMLTAATGWADHGPKTIHGSFACSISPSNFDPSNDGTPAGLDLCTGKGNLGPFTSQVLVDLLPPLAAPLTCPAGTVEFPYFGSITVATYSSEDQVNSGELGAGTFCLDFSTGTFTFDVTEDVIGGIGKFTGATGSIESKGPVPSCPVIRRAGAWVACLGHSPGHSSSRRAPSQDAG